MSFFVISLRILVSLENSVSCFLLFGYLFLRSRLSLRFVMIVTSFQRLLKLFFASNVFLLPIFILFRKEKLDRIKMIWSSFYYDSGNIESTCAERYSSVRLSIIFWTGRMSLISSTRAPANTSPFSTSPETEVSNESNVQNR